MKYEQIERAYDKYVKQLRLGESREDRNAFGRGAFMVAARQYLSLKQTGLVAGKHHSTVIHYEKNHDINMKYAPYYKEFFELANTLIENTEPRKYDHYTKILIENSDLKARVRDLERQIKMMKIC